MAIIAWDDFDRADNPNSLGTSPSGHLWSVTSGTWGVIGNKSYQSIGGGEGTYEQATIDIGLTSYLISANLFDSNFSYISLVGSCVDVNNYYMIIVNIGSTTSVGIWKLVAGVFTNIAPITYSAVSGDKISLKKNGTQLTAYANDAQIGTVTDTSHNGTKVGLNHFNGGTNAQWDNFVAQNLVTSSYTKKVFDVRHKLAASPGGRISA